MARKDPIEEGLGRLADLRREADESAVRAELEAALKQRKSGLLVAKAAELVAELAVDGLTAPMEEAFQRLLVEPIQRDKGCLGKTAVAKTLVELDRPSMETFTAGVHFVQAEPSWGGTTDTASQLRGWCAHGLVRARHPDAVLLLAPLLVDPERPARVAAVEALGDSGREAAEAVLRLKVLTGDEEPEVVGECFTSLLRLEPRRSLDFVGGFLDHREPAVVEGAALALGESRLEGAVERLEERLERTVRSELQRSFYLALSLTRHERAVERLVADVAEGPIGRAGHALTALALHRHDERLRQRLRDLVTERHDRELEKIWREHME